MDETKINLYFIYCIYIIKRLPLLNFLGWKMVLRILMFILDNIIDELTLSYHTFQTANLAI